MSADSRVGDESPETVPPGLPCEEVPSAPHAESDKTATAVITNLRTSREYLPTRTILLIPVTEPHITLPGSLHQHQRGYLSAMNLRITVLLAAIGTLSTAAFDSPPVAATGHPDKSICADYLGVVKCIVVTEPAPKSPSTTPGMQAVASPTTVRVDGTVTVTAGGRPGGHGYTKGEVVRLFEFWKGMVTELTGTKFADGTGSITFRREYLSLVGVDTEGPRTLCARGERSLRMACTTITVGSTTTATTAAPAPSSGPKSSGNTAGMVAKGTKTTVSPGQITKITFGPQRGKKGFTPGEKIVLYDFVNGSRTTLDTAKAGSTGSVTFPAGWAEGTSGNSTHELCSYGMSSKKLSCYKVETVGYSSPSSAVTTTTVAPATPTTVASTVPHTTVPPYAPPVAG